MIQQSASSGPQRRRPIVLASTIEPTGRPGTLDAELRPVDELATRYYHHNAFYVPATGGRHPLDTGARGPEAPMPDDELLFDQVRARMGKSDDKGVFRNRLVLDTWYTRGGSSAQKAKRLAISRTTLYLYWKTALSYVRGRFHERGVSI